MTATDPQRPSETAREHVAHTRHSVSEGAHKAWTCDNCSARSPLYDLRVTAHSDHSKPVQDE